MRLEKTVAELVDPLLLNCYTHARARDKEIEVKLIGRDQLIPSKHFCLLALLPLLLQNAVDHGIDRKGRITVRIASGDRTEISVSDNGRGVDLAALAVRAREQGIEIPEDNRKLVFKEGLTTANEVTDTSGLGMGLATLHSVVTSVGGKVLLVTTWGGGTTFSILAPV